MPPRPLGVAVVWHMHQPWYRDDVAGQFVLPWVRRRATKDYLHMLQLLERHPEVRVTMNFVPSLLRQIETGGPITITHRDAQRFFMTIAEAASLVSAQIELSVLPEQEERLAQAELRALRAQISPHFLYNALAAVAGNIHARPEEAREQLIDFAEFTRYLFRDGRSYVTLAEELDHVERYLRLEQARFPDTLHVTVQVDPVCRGTIVPALSVQPLVENAVRHGILDRRRSGGGHIAIEARVLGADVELRVRDDGSGTVRTTVTLDVDAVQRLGGVRARPAR